MIKDPQNTPAHPIASRPRSKALAAALAGFLLPALAFAEPARPKLDLSHDWPHWRGPLATGVAPHANPPTVWSESTHVRWKLNLPGQGHSTPIVLGNTVYVTAAAPVGEAQPPVYDKAPGVHDSVPVRHRHAFSVHAIDRARGNIVWSRVLREEFPHEGGHVTGSQASNSPVTDGELLYVFFGSRGLYGLQLDGTPKWQRDLGKMSTLHAHGEGSSPVVYGDVLLVNWDHEGQSSLFAFEKASGKTRWKVDRDEKTSWSTPLVVEVDGKPQVVVSATKRVRGYDLATGTLIWECGGLTDNVVSSPVFTEGILVTGNSYYVQAMMGIRLAGARGDLSGGSHVAWRMSRLSPYVSSPLLYDNTVYYPRHNQNVLVRLNPLTGEFRSDPQRIEGIRDFIFASPIGAAGRIYLSARDGTTGVLQSGAAGEVLSVNKLDDSFSASPAAVGDDLFLRGQRFLYALSNVPSTATQPGSPTPTPSKPRP